MAGLDVPGSPTNRARRQVAYRRGRYRGPRPGAALIEEDLGRDLAMKVAAQLVMFFKRLGGQMQFSRSGESLPAGRSVLQEVQRFVAANPASDDSVASLAARANLSPRHFARLFHSEVAVTPAAWVEAARVSAARRLLEVARDAPKQAAVRCGFANADTLRRAFVRQVGVTPARVPQALCCVLIGRCRANLAQRHFRP